MRKGTFFEKIYFFLEKVLLLKKGTFLVLFLRNALVYSKLFNSSLPNGDFAPARHSSNKFDSALAYSKLFGASHLMIAGCARHNLSKLSSALTCTAIPNS